MENSTKLTVIKDPVLDPYFITVGENGGYVVNCFRKGSTEKYTTLKYPATFERCLYYIAQEKLNEPGKVYESINEYLERWKEITEIILGKKLTL